MKNLSIIIIALSFALTVNAQTENSFAATSPAFAADFMEKGTTDAFGESIAIGMDLVEETTETSKTTELIEGFKRTAKPLAEGFTGITIQITTADRQLGANNPLFTQFGGIKVMEMLSPKYCYFLGSFNTKEGAEKFLNNMISSRYPNAKVVTFKKGKIK